MGSKILPFLKEEKTVEVKNGGDWSSLPDLPLNTVFTYLPRTDQESASQVCRNWSRAMDNPNLWRKIVVSFVDIYNRITLESLQMILRITKRYGHHLRNLTIDCDRDTVWENPELERPLITNIDNIHGRAQLKNFKLKHFNLDRGNKRESSILGKKLHNSVCRFLKTQHTLSEVIMTNHFATVNQGNRILQAIAEGCGSTLQTLKMGNLFNGGHEVFSNATYLSIVDNFKHLEVLSCDYRCISEAVILCLAHNCAERLRSLVIRCWCEDITSQTIGNDVWKQLKKECPNVLVDFKLEEIEGMETLKRLVPCHVPLRFLLYSTSELSAGEEALVPINFLTYVFTNFENTLEDLQLDFDHTVPKVENVVEEFLPRLKNLKRLLIKAEISDAFIDKVNAMREQKLFHLSEFRPTKYDRISEELWHQRFLNYFFEVVR